MTRSLLGLVSTLALLASCGKHPLHGGWREEGAAAPLVLEFDAGSNELMVHTPPRADGGHDHLHGTYSLLGGAISVEWHEGKATKAYSGKVEGDRMELSNAAQEKVAFVRGGSAH